MKFAFLRLQSVKYIFNLRRKTYWSKQVVKTEAADYKKYLQLNQKEGNSRRQIKDELKKKRESQCLLCI